MNRIQQIQMDRVRLCQYNEFDGPTVARSLEGNRELWDAFMLGRFQYHTIIELRDMAEGHLNVDTLMILTDKDRAEKLRVIAKQVWKADEIGYCGIDHKGEFFAVGVHCCHNTKELWEQLGGLNENQVLMRVWWD